MYDHLTMFGRSSRSQRAGGINYFWAKNPMFLRNRVGSNNKYGPSWIKPTMACRCEEWHGGCAGQDTFAFNEANWYLVDTDTKYFGWIYSWRDMVGLSRLMEDFPHYLFVWPWFPVVWLDNDANRTNAPLFIVARYGKGKLPHTCYFQFGCRYCRRQTELLNNCNGKRSVLLRLYIHTRNEEAIATATRHRRR